MTPQSTSLPYAWISRGSLSWLGSINISADSSGIVGIIESSIWQLYDIIIIPQFSVSLLAPESLLVAFNASAYNTASKDEYSSNT